jgi:hypothetical protein
VFPNKNWSEARPGGPPAAGPQFDSFFLLFIFLFSDFRKSERKPALAALLLRCCSFLFLGPGAASPLLFSFTAPIFLSEREKKKETKKQSFPSLLPLFPSLLLSLNGKK